MLEPNLEKISDTKLKYCWNNIRDVMGVAIIFDVKKENQ